MPLIKCLMSRDCINVRGFWYMVCCERLYYISTTKLDLANINCDIKWYNHLIFPKWLQA